MRALKLCVAVIPDENFESRRTLAEGSHMYCIRKGKVPIGCKCYKDAECLLPFTKDIIYRR